MHEFMEKNFLLDLEINLVPIWFILQRIPMEYQAWDATIELAVILEIVDKKLQLRVLLLRTSVSLLGFG